MRVILASDSIISSNRRPALLILFLSPFRSFFIFIGLKKEAKNVNLLISKAFLVNVNFIADDMASSKNRKL